MHSQNIFRCRISEKQNILSKYIRTKLYYIGYLPIPRKVSHGVDEKFTHISITFSPQMSADLQKYTRIQRILKEQKILCISVFLTC